MMPVEINHWGAAIGRFHASMQILYQLLGILQPRLILFQIFKLYWYFYRFLAAATIVLPIILTIKFFTSQFFAPKSCFLALLIITHQSANMLDHNITKLFYIKCKALCKLGIYFFRMRTTKKKGYHCDILFCRRPHSEKVYYHSSISSFH